MSKPQLNLVSQTLRALNPRSVQTIKIMIVSCPCLHSKKKKVWWAITATEDCLIVLCGTIAKLYLRRES